MEYLRAAHLSVDKDGVWYSDGLPVVKKEIIVLFATHLKKEGRDEYYIDWNNHSYPVKIEDAPFMAEALLEKDGRLVMRLYDGREFPLPEGDVIIKNEIPYVSLFWYRDTRLSQHAYWMLCEHAIERDGKYLFKYKDNEWAVEDIE